MNNIPKTRMLLMQRSALAVLLAMILVLTLARNSESARPMQRPVSNSAGQILQSYLWATESGTRQHKGIDFPNLLGTDVYAVADGTVVDIEEGVPDGTYPPWATPWGNFVLIRHNSNLQHYDATTSANAYTYTIYAHLSEGSIIPNDGDSVTAGSHIADIDSTGDSTGHHLHFQVVLNPSTDLDNIELDPNTLESENRSRNPELWITPYPGTGTAIGKVSDWGGNPVMNLRVCGIEKNSQWNYTTARTYSFSWANPDDILHENFGTTDVNPGTYDLYTVALGSTCNGQIVYDLGNHTFASNRVTYVGLYPSWLPLVRETSTNWDADIYVRNHVNEIMNLANVSYTTFVGATNKAVGQQSRSIFLNNGTAVIGNEPNSSYSAIVAPNRDSSVVIMSRWQGQPVGYTSIVATNINNDVFISPGWDRAGSTLYVPLVKDTYVDRSSQIYIINVGAQNTYVNVTYYNQAGVAYTAQQNLLLPPNVRVQLTPTTYTPNNNYYSARITSVPGYNQPLAAVVLERGRAGSVYHWPAMYNAFSSGNTTLYAPLVKKNYAGNTTGITLHNISSSAANFQAIYYDMNGNQVCTSPPWPCQPVVIIDTISAHSPYVLYNPSEIPDGFLGSVRITSTNGQPLVGQMSEGNGNGGLRQMSNLALGGSSTIYLPVWYDNYAVNGSWMSGVNVRNAGTGPATITARWYDQNGAFVLEQTASLDNSNDTHNFYDTSLTGFIGSVVITSNSGPIVAVSNVRNWSLTNTDAVMAFNGSNR